MHYEFLCEWDADEKALKALKVATQRDRKAFRVPTFIQSEEWPMCCNRSMHFVGQIDDNDVCTSPAAHWWHDAASFYVFTCDQRNAPLGVPVLSRPCSVQRKHMF